MKIKIGGIPYTLIRQRDLRAADGTKLNGCINCDEMAIYIEATLPPISAQQTLLHEIIHGILIQGGIKEHSEAMVEILAYGILSVLMSNRSLTEF